MNFALDWVVINNLADSNTAYLAANHAPAPADAHRRVMKAHRQLTRQVRAFAVKRSLQKQVAIYSLLEEWMKVNRC